jgi:hypothetical protein
VVGLVVVLAVAISSSNERNYNGQGRNKVNGNDSLLTDIRLIAILKHGRNSV